MFNNLYSKNFGGLMSFELAKEILRYAREEFEKAIKLGDIFSI